MEGIQSLENRLSLASRVCRLSVLSAFGSLCQGFISGLFLLERQSSLSGALGKQRKGGLSSLEAEFSGEQRPLGEAREKGGEGGFPDPNCPALLFSVQG